MIYLDNENIIKLISGFAFKVFAMILITRGIFGIIKNEISIGNATPLSYRKKSIMGKLINIVIIFIGVIALVIGINSILE